MQLKLILTNTTSKEVSESVVQVEDKVIFGRHLGSPILLEGDAISRQHFSIAVQDGQPTVENLSSNGTMLNGAPLQGPDAIPLMTGDVLEVPGYKISIETQNDTSNDSAGEPSPSVGTKKAVAWKKMLQMVTTFFDPLEVVLILCAMACIALTAYYISS